MDNLEKQDDYVVLSSIQCAYDNDMVILKGSKTYAPRYVGSKIFVYVLGTKNGLFPFEENGRKRTLLDKLKNTHAHKNQ